MKEVDLTVISNERLTKDTYKLWLRGVSEKQRAGQFVEIKLSGFTLRRPFCVADVSKGDIALVYRVLGAGTSAMTQLKAGDKINTLISLGNGFSDSLCKSVLLIGGGLGTAPLLLLAKELIARGINPTMVVGGRSKDDLVLFDEFSKICNTLPATDDGSLGFKGNAVQLAKTIEKDYECFYACGPEVMLRALRSLSIGGEISMEARMACGFGACMGCSIKTTKGFRRVCKEGPVFKLSEVIFDE